MGTNKCLWHGSTEHFITACPQRLKTNNVGEAGPPSPPRHGPVPLLRQGPRLRPCQGTAAPFRQGPLPIRSTLIGRAYVINEKDATTSGTVVTDTRF